MLQHNQSFHLYNKINQLRNENNINNTLHDFFKFIILIIKI